MVSRDELRTVRFRPLGIRGGTPTKYGNDPAKDVHGFFHGWGGTSEWVYAIVEDLDGEIYLVDSDHIRFTGG